MAYYLKMGILIAHSLKYGEEICESRVKSANGARDSFRHDVRDFEEVTLLARLGREVNMTASRSYASDGHGLSSCLCLAETEINDRVGQDVLSLYDWSPGGRSVRAVVK